MFEKLKKYGFFRYGKIIPNLEIHGASAPYPVLNERAVRAGAGMMMMLGIFAFSFAYFQNNFLPLKIVVSFFFLDFFAKTVLGTKFSPVSNLANFIVKNQRPEYTGAVQKRFAWGLGLFMSSLVLTLLFVFKIDGGIVLALCGFCLALMWFETSFGICLGCKIYYGFIKLGWIHEPQVRPACPGGACSINKQRKS